MRARTPLPVVVAALGGCSGLTFDGTWVGTCETPGLGMRLVAAVQETNDERTALVEVRRPDRPGEILTVDCATAEVSGRDVDVAGCRGGWDATPQPTDFAIHAAMEHGELVAILLGACRVDGVNGDLELWQMP